MTLVVLALDAADVRHAEDFDCVRIFCSTLIHRCNPSPTDSTTPHRRGLALNRDGIAPDGSRDHGPR